jgi:hypothetical protein
MAKCTLWTRPTITRGPETPAYNARSDTFLVGGAVTNVLMLAVVVFMEERVPVVAVAAVRFNADVEWRDDNVNDDGCDLVEDGEGKSRVSFVCIHTFALSIG